jgi:spore germination protein YaaH
MLFKTIISALTLCVTFFGFSQSEVTVTIGYPDHEDYFIYSIPPADEHARFGGEYYFKVENTGSIDLLNWEINTIWKTLNSTWGVVDKTIINSSTGEIKLTGPGWDTDLSVGESFVISGEWISSGSVEDWVDFLPRDIEMVATSGGVTIVYDTNGEVNTGPFTVQKTQPITDDLKSYQDLKVVAYFPIFDAENAWCSLQRYGDNIDQLRVQLYSITPNGVLRAGQDLPNGLDPIDDLHYWYDYIEDMGVVDYCVTHNIELIPVVFNYNPDINDFDQSAVHTMMTTPSLKTAHISDLISVLNDKPAFSGIDIDYESLMATDRNNYSTFMEDLAVEVHANGKIITTAVHTKVGPGTWYGPQAQDFERLGNAVDEILFMTYDLHWATSPTFTNPPPTAGCQSTPDWMNDVAMFGISEIDDPSKIQLGIPFYGYRWKYLFENHDLNDAGVGLTYKDAQALIQEYNIPASSINREANGNEPYFNVDIDGTDWVCYFQDEISLEYKLTALDEHNLRDYIGGIGIWRLGGESDEMWNAVMTSTQNVNATINTSQDCSLGTLEMTDALFTIFPNPVRDRVNLSFNQINAPDKISIVSASGQLVFETKDIISFIDVSDLADGIYFIQIKNNNFLTTKKFIKN